MNTMFIMWKGNFNQNISTRNQVAVSEMVLFFYIKFQMLLVLLTNDINYTLEILNTRLLYYMDIQISKTQKYIY